MMRKKETRPSYYSYTAILEEDSSGFWMVSFPDLEGCATNAKTLEEAIIQAHNVLEDYMAITERDDGLIPAPTPFEKIEVPNGAIIQRIVVSMQGARKRWEDHAINRMVTLHAWLDEKGREANLNFSQLLQTAVTRELNL
jgi:predicted RNase H-like HicB family nuclease